MLGAQLKRTFWMESVFHIYRYAYNSINYSYFYIFYFSLSFLFFVLLFAARYGTVNTRFSFFPSDFYERFCLTAHTITVSRSIHTLFYSFRDIVVILLPFL